VQLDCQVLLLLVLNTVGFILMLIAPMWIFLTGGSGLKSNDAKNEFFWWQSVLIILLM